MSAAEAIRPIADGVFFRVPRSLPRGKNALGRNEVVRIQRERTLIAVTELLAARGPHDFGPKDICSRAGLSLSSFYSSFATKEECVFEAYDRFIGHLLTSLAVIDGAGRPWGEYVRMVLDAYLGALSADPVVAMAFQVEMDAMGPGARRRRREALSGVAKLLFDKHVEWDPGARDRFPFEAYLSGVYGIRQLAADALEAGDRERLESLAPLAADWVSTMFGAGPDHA
ncbi:hypothetical protein NSZ01_36040 [Nocardioides szechwanensis]|uniref:Transcriptional regulator, TetR family n=1 Tax=Nocardioides szechwanensis TaxID=1005944 RepID=A0A1G9ZY61_9ACTN|nr:TetR family transcriptional regulator [Nocardioides szechwanensis]GEP35836.1 hypothetical protein NSZ01_36040 [Nocardioides szechwanensis]SDN25633.1 transcriptional regulator, TetR family [Nocardioides szechwanensis]